MKAWFRYVQPLALAATVAVVFGACNEQLEGGSACPLLCPQLPSSVRDTTLFAAELDTSIAGFPSLGREAALFLASFGDTLQTRGVVRYDSLPNRFVHNAAPTTDSAVISVDTGAIVRFTVLRGDTLDTAGGTVELYDVDLDGVDDPDPTAVGSRFTPDRFLGSRDYTAKDTLVDVPVNPDKLLAKIQAPYPANRLRVGVRVTGPESAKLSVRTTESAAGARLIYRPAAGDTSVALTTVSPRSLTPPDPFLAADLADFLIVTTPPPAAPADVIRVGGLPGQRAYLKFNIPSRIVDSSNVVRATLLLTQRPNAGAPSAIDSIAIEPLAVTAGPPVTDISKALLFLFGPSVKDSLRAAPVDGGVRELEIVRIVKLWSATAEAKTPRALALHSLVEGNSAGELDFYSIEAPANLRPQVRITYIPRPQGGIP